MGVREPERDGEQESWVSDPAVPLVAHELLGAMRGIQGMVKELARRGDDLTAEQRSQYLNLVAERAAHVESVLGDLVRGVPVDALRAVSRRRASE